MLKDKLKFGNRQNQKVSMASEKPNDTTQEIGSWNTQKRKEIKPPKEQREAFPPTFPFRAFVFQKDTIQLSQ